MSSAWKEYIDKNKERFLEEMLALLRIPSVSAKSEHTPDMQTCAEAVKTRPPGYWRKTPAVSKEMHDQVYETRINKPGKRKDENQ
jgi:hypothetical protein